MEPYTTNQVLKRIAEALESIAESLKPSPADEQPARLYTVEVWESDVSPGGYNESYTLVATNTAEALQGAISQFKQDFPTNTGNLDYRIQEGA